jgi:hypothetical protein
VKDNRYGPDSRYFNLETARFAGSDGRPLIYLGRRVVPPAERFEALGEHTVADGQRLDQIAAQYLGDPLQFWRLCDANNAVDPAELEEPGRRLRITLPEGIPANR